MKTNTGKNRPKLLSAAVGQRDCASLWSNFETYRSFKMKAARL